MPKASVLAFEKKLVPSDGLLYGSCWGDSEQETRKLIVKEKTVRGTISNRLKKNMQEDPAKLDAEIEKANIQTIDFCTLENDQDTIILNFTLKFLSGVEHPSSCNNQEYSDIYSKCVNNYIKNFGFEELAGRYAYNIENARYLWRNRVGAEKINVHVKVINEDKDGEWDFDSTSMDISNFENSQQESHNELTKLIADTLAGDNQFLLLDIRALAKVGNGQEVYPSEELVRKTRSNDYDKSKFLYQINNQAALHSQKIGNALRTIDTWYKADSDDEFVGPIAIDPYGAVTNRGTAYRNPRNRLDFYTLLDKMINEAKWDQEQQHYVMAVLLRGGVFGESSNQ